MENKQTPSKNKLISIQEEKLIREVNYHYLAAGPTRSHRSPLLLDLEILQKNPAHRKGSQKVLVSIKPRAPAIKTLYIAEKNRYHSRKGSSKSGSHLAIGDHSSFTTHPIEDDSNILITTSIACGFDENEKIESDVLSTSVTFYEQRPTFVTGHSQESPRRPNLYNDKPNPAEKCYLYTQPQLNKNTPKLEIKVNKSLLPNRVDVATLVVTNSSSENTAVPHICSTILNLVQKIDFLERKILRQEMVFRSLDPNIDLSSSDEEAKDITMRSSSGSGRPGCSYIQQYSHVPETSAFQKYAHPAAPLSPSKATTIQKEHNSEQYGRDFTAYDGITARGRRQCASVPCKRDDVPKLAAERVHKIRHKLNPVRDYRLMDTVHYLAQGEFAPRDDGIKLTPSREAVLSDIIWEDVCRTHWPNTRLGRRGTHTERERGTRGELQRLIDSLLRERVAHVERRRRRHYRIVKLNHRHESCRPVGKTGDIIVASHKNRPGSEDAAASDMNAGSVSASNQHHDGTLSPHRSPRSHDREIDSDLRHKQRYTHDDCSPGPSYVSSAPAARQPTCCYQTSTRSPTSNSFEPSKNKCCTKQDLSSGSSDSAYKSQARNPRLVIKKDGSGRRHSKEDTNLEQFILLPTLVVRSPSNMKRQKKFNELYHRILNTQLNAPNSTMDYQSPEIPVQNFGKKDIGFNVNITISNTTEEN